MQSRLVPHGFLFVPRDVVVWGIFNWYFVAGHLFTSIHGSEWKFYDWLHLACIVDLNVYNKACILGASWLGVNKVVSILCPQQLNGQIYARAVQYYRQVSGFQRKSRIHNHTFSRVQNNGGTQLELGIRNPGHPRNKINITDELIKASEHSYGRLGFKKPNSQTPLGVVPCPLPPFPIRGVRGGGRRKRRSSGVKWADRNGCSIPICCLRWTLQSDWLALLPPSQYPWFSSPSSTGLTLLISLCSAPLLIFGHSMSSSSWKNFPLVLLLSLFLLPV